MPIAAHANGLDSSRNRPTLNASPESADRPETSVHECSVTLSKKKFTSEEKVESNYDYEKGRETICVVGPVISHFWGERMIVVESVARMSMPGQIFGVV
jgi:hypothetical protein